MTDKNGQVTLFIVFGILLIFIVIMLAFTSNIFNKQTIQTSLPTNPVTVYVEGCLRQAALEAVLENGKTGGYFVLPEARTSDLPENVPHYVERGMDISPADQELGGQLAAYVDVVLPFCLRDFQEFREQGYTITAESHATAVTIGPHSLLVQTTMPLTIEQDMARTVLSTFTATVPAEQYYDDILLARQIAQMVNTREVCLTCFSAQALENDVFVGILPYQDNTYLFDLGDNNYTINNETYHLRFAVRYGDEEQ